jgi:hypothetical protein
MNSYIDGWLNNEVRFGSTCHDSRGNLVDGLGNPLKEAKEVVEEEGQERDEELKLKLKLKTRTGRHTEVAFRLIFN